MAAEIIRRRKDGEDWALDMERSLDRQRPPSRALPFAWPASRSTTWVWSESLMSETELKIEDLHFHDLRHEGASCTLDRTITGRCIRGRREEWIPLHSLRRRWRGTASCRRPRKARRSVGVISSTGTTHAQVG
ncbi:hypothetical protein [Bradyrhizobium sp. USDA 4451]